MNLNTDIKMSMSNSLKLLFVTYMMLFSIILFAGSISLNKGGTVQDDMVSENINKTQIRGWEIESGNIAIMSNERINFSNNRIGSVNGKNNISASRSSDLAIFYEVGGATLFINGGISYRFIRGPVIPAINIGIGLLSAYSAFALLIGGSEHQLELSAGIRASFLYEQKKDLALPFYGVGYRYWPEKGLFTRITGYYIYCSFPDSFEIINNTTTTYKYVPWLGLSLGIAF